MSLADKLMSVEHLIDHRCAYCGSKFNGRDVKSTTDHIIPKNKGGGDYYENITFCCLMCNSSKSDLSLEEWKERLANKIDYLNNNNSAYRTAKRMGFIKEIKKEITFYFEKLG